MIGGNIIALFQVKIKDKGKKNAIGEREHEWVDVASVKGFLDLSTGDSKHTTFNAKIQESTHIFLCDYNSLIVDKTAITSGNARILIDDKFYQIQLIDDPMGMHQHLEIFLKYVGGQNG